MDKIVFWLVTSIAFLSCFACLRGFFEDDKSPFFGTIGIFGFRLTMGFKTMVDLSDVYFDYL